MAWAILNYSKQFYQLSFMKTLSYHGFCDIYNSCLSRVALNLVRMIHQSYVLYRLKMQLLHLIKHPTLYQKGMVWLYFIYWLCIDPLKEFRYLSFDIERWHASFLDSYLCFLKCFCYCMIWVKSNLFLVYSWQFP